MHPCGCSNEYPLFIPRQNYCTTSVENSWTDKNSSNFGIASMDSDRKEARLDSTGRNSFNYSSASPHSVESHRDLQKGIALLKKSVACLTAYCYNSLSLEVPPETSTFDAFAKLLATLSSSKEVRSVFSLKMTSSRYTTSFVIILYTRCFGFSFLMFSCVADHARRLNNSTSPFGTLTLSSQAPYLRVPIFRYTLILLFRIIFCTPTIIKNISCRFISHLTI